MKNKTIKNIFISEVGYLFIIIIIEVLLWFIYYKNLDTTYVYLLLPLQLFFLQLVIIKLIIVIKCLILIIYMKNCNIKSDENILWWNGKNCFFMNNVIIIFKFRINKFKYSEIVSIQVSQKVKNKGRGKSYSLYNLNFNLSNNIEPNVFLCSDKSYIDSNEVLDEITKILLEKNPKVKVKEMKKFNPCESVFIPFE